MDRGAWELQSIGSHSIGHDWAHIHTHTHTDTHTLSSHLGSSPRPHSTNLILMTILPSEDRKGEKGGYLPFLLRAPHRIQKFTFCSCLVGQNPVTWLSWDSREPGERSLAERPRAQQKLLSLPKERVKVGDTRFCHIYCPVLEGSHIHSLAPKSVLSSGFQPFPGQPSGPTSIWLVLRILFPLQRAFHACEAEKARAIGLSWVRARVRPESFFSGRLPLCKAQAHFYFILVSALFHNFLKKILLSCRKI